MNDHDLFDRVRDLARARCEDSIRETRRTLQGQLEAIDELAAALTDPSAEANEFHYKDQFGELIWTMVPKDRVFGFKELKERIDNSGADPVPAIPTIRAHMRRWVKAGKLKTVRNMDGRQSKLWAVPAVKGDDPLPALSEMIATVLDEANSKLRPVEIAVELAERGWEMDKEPAEMVQIVLRELRRSPDVFIENSDGQWAAID